MQWLWRHGVDRSFVNTQLENDAARWRSTSRSASRPPRRSRGAWDVRCEHAVRRRRARRRTRPRASRGSIPRRRRQTSTPLARAHLAGLDREPRHRHVHDELRRTSPRRPHPDAHRPRPVVVARARSTPRPGDNPPLAQTLNLVRLSLDVFPPTQFGVRTVPLDLTDLGLRRSGNGVYPLEVQLRDVNETRSPAS